MGMQVNLADIVVFSAAIDVDRAMSPGEITLRGFDERRGKRTSHCV